MSSRRHQNAATGKGVAAPVQHLRPTLKSHARLRTAQGSCGVVAAINQLSSPGSTPFKPCTIAALQLLTWEKSELEVETEQRTKAAKTGTPKDRVSGLWCVGVGVGVRT